MAAATTSVPIVWIQRPGMAEVGATMHSAVR